MLKGFFSDWELRITKAQVGHYLAAERYQKIHFYVGAALVVSSSFVTSSLFLETKNEFVDSTIIFTSILSTILAGIQTLIRPSEQAEGHVSYWLK